MSSGPGDESTAVAATMTASQDGVALEGEGAWVETDRYTLVDEIGRGGGGRIAVAFDRKLGRRVAIKRPVAGGGARLEREARVLARLEHPGIVPVHDAGRDGDGAPFYAMKLLGGADLGARIRAADSLAARLALVRVVGAVADAMAYAHAQGVIHRDLKPANVVVGEFGEVAVIDWGLAKVIDGAAVTTSGLGAIMTSAELTTDGAVVGTPAYMAPEQANGRALDQRTDVYALGAMLYHVLVGELPYGSIGAAEQIKRIRAGAPVPVEVREPRVPRELAAIVGKAMARAPIDRYPSARELAADLERYQTGRLVAAHRYSPVMRARKWLGRHPLAVALAIGAAAIAGAAAFVMTRAPAVADTCVDLDRPVRAIWNDGARAEIGKAFAASGVAYAPAAWRGASQVLDRHADAIVAMRLDACRERARGAQSSEVLELRTQCLDARVAQLGAVVRALGAPDPALVSGAGALVGSLDRVDDCADVRRLRDRLPLPADATRRALVDEVDREAFDLRARGDGGHPVDARVRAPALLGVAYAAAYPPAIADALHAYGHFARVRGEYDLAGALLWQALTAADASHDDRGRARALLELAAIASSLEHFDEAARLDDQVAAIADRLGSDDLRVNVDYDRGTNAGKRGHDDEAIADFERALASLARDPRDNRLREAEVYGQLGNRYIRLGRLDDAQRAHERSLAQLRELYGTDDDPAVGIELGDLASLAYSRHDNDAALALYQQANAIFARTLAPGAETRMSAEQNTAVVLNALERYDDARAILEELLPHAEAALGKNHAAVASILYNLGDVARMQLHPDQALAYYRESYARRAAVDPASAETAIARMGMGSALVELNRLPEAIVELRGAVAAEERALGPDLLDVAEARLELAQALIEGGDPAGALPVLARAAPVLARAGTALEHGHAVVLLAIALARTGDAAGARARADDARAILTPLGADGTNDLEQLAKVVPPRGR